MRTDHWQQEGNQTRTPPPAKPPSLSRENDAIPLLRFLALCGILVVQAANLGETVHGAGAFPMVVRILSGHVEALWFIAGGVFLASLQANRKIRVRRWIPYLGITIAGLIFHFWLKSDFALSYGLSMLILLWLTRFPRWILRLAALALTGGYVWWFLQVQQTGEAGVSPWYLRGILSGSYPLVPWLVFPITGYLTGLQLDEDRTRLRKTALITLGMSFFFGILSDSLIEKLTGNGLDPGSLHLVLGIAPNPPMPFFVLHAASTGVFIAALVFWIFPWIRSWKMVRTFCRTGSWSFFYYLLFIFFAGIFLVINPGDSSTLLTAVPGFLAGMILLGFVLPETRKPDSMAHKPPPDLTEKEE